MIKVGVKLPYCEVADNSPTEDEDNVPAQLQFNGLFEFCSKLQRRLFDLFLFALDCVMDEEISSHRCDHCSMFSTSLFLSSSFSGNLSKKSILLESKIKD